MQYFSPQNRISVSEVMKNINSENSVNFRIGVDFEDLLSWDINGLNSYLDDCVEDGKGYLLEDIAYLPVDIDHIQKLIVVQVHADATHFMEEATS